MTIDQNISGEGSWPLVLVTGPSGAGRSTAINALEDIGFETIDNLPLSLLQRLLDGPDTGRPLALGIDVRNRDFSEGALLHLIETLGEADAISATVVYLDCRPEVLQRRFSETRRRHPLSPENAPMVGIEAEIALLAQVKAVSDTLIDTSDMSPHDLKADLSRLFSKGGSDAMAVTVESFSYKRGVPRGADTVFDCRFLKNPHWEEALRDMDGRSVAVAEFIQTDDGYEPFRSKVVDLMSLLLGAYRKEGKTHFTISFGCTGGKHRSVALAETVASAGQSTEWLLSNGGLHVGVVPCRRSPFLRQADFARGAA